MTRKGLETRTKKNKKAYGASLYIIMALCLTVVMTVGIISLIYDYRQDDFDFSIPEFSIPPRDESIPTKPVDKTPSDVDPEVSAPEEKTKNAKPVEGGIIKGFSPDKLVFSQTMQDYRIHSGVDIAAPLGASVLAFEDGVVESITDTPLMGIEVVIAHEDGLKSIYMNLSEEGSKMIKAGMELKAGDVIGEVGRTAIVEISEPSHLHFELIKDGELIDPEPVLAAIE